ncbi:hypothetical protein BDY17DRAFT_289784 [Neohortaea acidophila]|uniref:Histone transcription regulator 3 homolog n=1 Tax=Neohortaea acidophila TaxID=245834 RepID=A0A6A6Q6C7_9PEZI|nr:uncharacterized protein BDY17DRAFT_289784 [Neohortaea acidophila]KAF2487842.1 hypothetical protein BDY17DRAFT_289784 [Neohortaea acidophila]
MSGFKALNIESDDESDIEIDDTKELQIEEALKLYQNALKLHSEGPASFELAAKAYEELFKSDIFQYPESQTELRRVELYGPSAETEDLWQDWVGDLAVLPAPGLETGPSTLPQILHLSHKNYAHFKLEYLTARLDGVNVSLNQILADATAALEHFVNALDKDDSDLDLWRRTAGVGSLLDSRRLARFCLEAVLDGDDDGLNSALSLPGLDEGLAGEQLRDLVRQLEDRLSLLQMPLSVGKRRVLSSMLKRRLNTYQAITDREITLRSVLDSDALAPAGRAVLQVPKTWAEVGEILLRQLMAEQHGTSVKTPGLAVSFDLDTASPRRPSLAIEPARLVDSNEESVHSASDLPSSIQEVFPGLDQGLPTVQPRIACADVTMEALVLGAKDDDVPMRTRRSSSINMPTRKRSGDVAGLNDGPEEGRTKSKRTRTRDSTMNEDSRQAIIDANTRWELEQKLAELQAADDWMFETVGNLFERIGVVGFEAGKNVRQELQSSSTEALQTVNGSEALKEGLQLAKADIHALLNNYSDQLGSVLTSGGENCDATPGLDSAGSTQASPHANGSKMLTRPSLPQDEGLLEFLGETNDQWLMAQEVAWRWICRLLRADLTLDHSRYREYVWPEKLKTMIVRTLVNFDEDFRHLAREEVDQWKESPERIRSDVGPPELFQTIYELHLDIYWLIKQPNSGVDADTVAVQRDRLQHWSEFAREVLRLRSQLGGTDDLSDELNLRFLWATTFQVGADPDVSQDYVIECMHDLRAIFVAANEPSIQLQNNAIMPELSTAALEKEISRLTTKDFFDKVTNQDVQDPVAIIENLEPLLESLAEPQSSPEEDARNDMPGVSTELTRFLENSSVSVRIMLWQRLRNAYLEIEYKPMVVSCHFKMIRLLLKDLKTSSSSDVQQSDRQVTVLKTLRLIHEMAKKTCAIVQTSKDAIECVDEHGLKAAIGSLGEISQLLQAFNIFEDSIRIGQSQPPSQPNGSTAASYQTVTSLVHDMQVHIWVILYSLLKDAVFQFHELFPAPAEDKFEFLKVVHRNLGLRGICGSSNRVFVRLVKDEFFQMTHVDGYDSEQAQVLYDLYGLNCFLNPNYELMEHGCIRDAFIDRSVALQAADLLMLQASKLPMRELIKHPIKDTIDKVHAAAPRKKPTDAIMRNREVQRAFLRSPINPLDLYNCLKGEGNELNVLPIPKADALLASKDWYFLMGHIALAKFRSVKRTGATPTEEVDIAIAFFMQDLEYSPDNWETWFRLAQAYDTKIEESVVWSAEKMNSSMPDIGSLQRAAIHCYTMATALAYRSADPTPETAEKMTELFCEFATRLYASSREPFSMLPFALEENEKFFSIPGKAMTKGKAFKPIDKYTVWKLAKVFFQKALAGKPDSWMLHFALGKCLWKMHTSSTTLAGSHNVKPAAQQVLASFIRAIELIPDKKDSREKREPVLEPHYKLLSTVHKMVMRESIKLEEAMEALQNTPYARNATFPQDLDEWVPYVLSVLKNLRNADKSNWHHRMIARAAQIIYDDSRADADGASARLGAMGAKHELTQQMFTKTMVLQVWRPESERAGRHFVYTSRYTRFFVRILEQLKDRSNLEMLARRIRRRHNDFFEHLVVWQDLCYTYLRLMRESAALPEGLETSTFSTIAHDEFLLRKEPLEKWMQAQETGTSPALDVLREVQELKKINQGLMKTGPIDDLIGDSYAYLFNTIGKQLWEEEKQRIEREEEANRPPPPPPAPQPPPVISPQRNPMMDLTSLMNFDGSQEPSAAANITPAAGAGTPQASTPQPAAGEATASETTAPARRKIGVGRREIRTCAEACLQKAQPAPSTQSTSRPLPRVQVLIDNSKEDWRGFMSVDSSAPGSVYSADDESELSSLEEREEDEEGGEEVVEGEGEEQGRESPASKVEPLRPVFPGLLDAAASTEASEGFETAEEEHVIDAHGDVEMVMDEEKREGNGSAEAIGGESDV